MSLVVGAFSVLNLLSVDIQSIFVPSGSVLELIIRGTLIYVTLFMLLRLVTKRQSGALGITDLLLIVLIADAVQNGMASEYRSVTEAIVLVLTIMFWSNAFNWLGHKFPRFQRLVYPPPLPLIQYGKMLRSNMKRELITEEELMTQLRKQGVSEVSAVKQAFMESDGNVSVVPFDPEERSRRRYFP